MAGNKNSGRRAERDAKGHFLKSDAPREQAPKRPQTKLPVNKKMTDTLVMLVNTGWQVSPWRAEAMSEVETEALSRSLLRAAQSNVYLGNIINKITTATAEAQLAGCIGAIVVSRLAMRGVVPLPVGIMAQTMIAGIAGEEVPADGLGAGPARSAFGDDGDGENNPARTPPPAPPMGGDAAGEIGYASMAEFQPDYEGQSNGHGATGPGRLDTLDPATPAGGARG